MSFKMDVSSIVNGLAQQELKTKASLNLYGNTVAKKMESHAKSNRRWTDRTADARNRLNGTCKQQGNGVRIEIVHGVDYGVYLELCNEKRYAVLEPTVKAISPDAIKGLSNLLK